MSEFAPEYTTKEKVTSLLMHAGWAIPVVLLLQFYVLPWLNATLARPPCLIGERFTNMALLLYGMLSLFPLLIALLLCFTEGKRSLQVLKLGQSPLPNEKVYKPTRYVYGNKAKLRPLFVFLVILGFGVLSAYGAYVVNDITAKIPLTDLASCTDSERN
jgi:hypothetical protein